MKRTLTNLVAFVPAVLAAMASPAHAELPAAVTAAITNSQTDILALLAALTTAGAAIWVGRLIYAKFKVRG